MKKWYYWFYLSLGFALGGIVNYIDGKQILAAAIQVGFTSLLAVVQLICDRRGEKGKKVFKYIFTVLIILLVAAMVVLIIYALA